MTAATAALDPEPAPGLGTGGDRRRHRDRHPGRLPRAGNASSPPARCSHPIQLRGRTDMIDLATGETRPALRTAPSRGSAARRVRQPPRGRLPVLLGGLQARRPPARPRGPGRRQRHPRDDHRAPVRVRHPHRPLLRPGPRPPHARQDRAALPPPPRRQGPALPARPRHLLPDPARRGRPPARPADVPATATTTQSAVLFNAYAGDLWRRFVTYLPRHLARLAGVTQKTLRAQVRIRFVKVAEYQARGVVHFHAVIRLDAPGEDYQPPPPGTPPPCSATPSTRPPPPSASPSTHDGQAVHARLRRRRPTSAHPRTARPARHRPAAERPGRRQLHRQVRHQDPRRSRPARPRHPARMPTSTQLRCSAHYRRDDHHRLAARRHPAPAIRGSGPGRTCSATAATS